MLIFTFRCIKMFICGSISGQRPQGKYISVQVVVNAAGFVEDATDVFLKNSNELFLLLFTLRATLLY